MPGPSFASDHAMVLAEISFAASSESRSVDLAHTQGESIAETHAAAMAAEVSALRETHSAEIQTMTREAAAAETALAASIQERIAESVAQAEATVHEQQCAAAMIQSRHRTRMRLRADLTDTYHQALK